MADENMNQGSTGGTISGGGTMGESISGGGTPTAGTPNKLESSRTHARQAAEDLKSAATAVAGDYRDKATQAWDEAKVRVRTLQEDGEDYVRENPMRAVFTALGIGFLLGLIFRR